MRETQASGDAVCKAPEYQPPKAWKLHGRIWWRTALGHTVALHPAATPGMWDVIYASRPVGFAWDLREAIRMGNAVVNSARVAARLVGTEAGR